MCKCPNCLVYKFVKFLYFCIYCLPPAQMELFLCVDEWLVCLLGWHSDGQAYFFLFHSVSNPFDSIWQEKNPTPWSDYCIHFFFLNKTNHLKQNSVLCCSYSLLPISQFWWRFWQVYTSRIFEVQFSAMSCCVQKKISQNYKWVMDKLTCTVLYQEVVLSSEMNIISQWYAMSGLIYLIISYASLVSHCLTKTGLKCILSVSVVSDFGYLIRMLL